MYNNDTMVKDKILLFLTIKDLFIFLLNVKERDTGSVKVEFVTQGHDIVKLAGLVWVTF
tara:strand:- start:141673 stop:141849 length:177 start_codon:yes stop_codon:yes gene_type:complete